MFYLVIGAVLALVAGWRLFWFMTDDAYIAFRYIGNSQAGYGYTWNLPPFRPAEGYTSFLMVPKKASESPKINKPWNNS